MLPICSGTLKPYTIGASASVQVYEGYATESPSQSCQKLAADQVATMVGVTQFQCITSASSSVYPIIKLCEPPVPGPFNMPVADGVQLSGLILSVWVSAAIARWFVEAVRNRSDDS